MRSAADELNHSRCGLGNGLLLLVMQVTVVTIVTAAEGNCDQLHSTRRRSTVTEKQKFDHEMVWKCPKMLDRTGHPVSNHISVISRLAGRFRCRRPRFDHLFELVCTSQQWKITTLPMDL